MGDIVRCKIDKREFMDYSHFRIVQKIRAHIRDAHPELGLEVLRHSFANLPAKGILITEILDFPPPPSPDPMWVVLDTHTGFSCAPLCRRHVQVFYDRAIAIRPEAKQYLQIVQADKVRKGEPILAY